ncbi:uncharacterized protein T551_03032 [Pneumocystis jirovecii RU7]|uniref:Transcription initiation factor TFIID subunit 10 n=1 Tax=Pneumocystis jirovecii (strain RU7) TaxID=1408657 RepID=A0A0W4ZGP1_PNEJ7|nr:uncharacterized protein T551_03032 [Pneumocystis jirovecii RU7]KTW27533.1 hypothetical protein T551_03032 [Pneumocystis jirovecii RU7]
MEPTAQTSTHKEKQTGDCLEYKENKDEIKIKNEETDIDPSKYEEEIEEEGEEKYKKQKDRTLKEFLNMMDDYAPIIPDAVTDYYLSMAGFECDDIRIRRLLALAAQKFIADIAQDAYQYSCIRSSSMMSAVLSNQTGFVGATRGRYGKDKGKTILTMEDLSAALYEYGINMKRPDFYR